MTREELVTFIKEQSVFKHSTNTRIGDAFTFGIWTLYPHETHPAVAVALGSGPSCRMSLLNYADTRKWLQNINYTGKVELPPQSTNWRTK